MKLEFKSFSAGLGTTFIFTEHGVEVVPESIPKPLPASRVISFKISPESVPRERFKLRFISYRRFVEFTISEPIENIYDIKFYGKGNPIYANHAALSILIECSIEDIEKLKVLLMEKMS
ncbi:MAG: hypothetical protein QNJ63_24020 [Calothrix sp. MO_192.B10]|nr:hypothetical protein [Calothrix sp. MO_192.B10]